MSNDADRVEHIASLLHRAGESLLQYRDGSTVDPDRTVALTQELRQERDRLVDLTTTGTGELPGLDALAGAVAAEPIVVELSYLRAYVGELLGLVKQGFTVQFDTHRTPESIRPDEPDEWSGSADVFPSDEPLPVPLPADEIASELLAARMRGDERRILDDEQRAALDDLAATEERPVLPFSVTVGAENVTGAEIPDNKTEGQKNRGDE